jgi:hypothetical protein
MKKSAIIALLAVAFCLLWVAVAYAATPQDIYNDYVANGKLTGTYTEAELQAYLNDATVHQYGDPGRITGLDTLVRKSLTTEQRQTFPFTGAQMLAVALGGLALVSGGVALRRTAKR